MSNASTFLTKERHDEFHLRLANLIAEYPELSGRMAREHAADPANECWEGCYPEEPHFDPAEPMYLNAQVLVMNFTSMTGWNDVCVTTPSMQNPFTTAGMLSHAQDTIA